MADTPFFNGVFCPCESVSEEGEALGLVLVGFRSNKAGAGSPLLDGIARSNRYLFQEFWALQNSSCVVFPATISLII